MNTLESLLLFGRAHPDLLQSFHEGAGRRNSEKYLTQTFVFHIQLLRIMLSSVHFHNEIKGFLEIVIGFEFMGLVDWVGIFLSTEGSSGLTCSRAQSGPKGLDGPD